MKKKYKYIIFLIFLLFFVLISFLIFNKSDKVKLTKTSKKMAEEYYTSGYYFVNSDENDNNVSIKFENDNGISKIINTVDNSELNCNMKKNIGIDYKIKDIDNDAFFVTNSIDEQSSLKFNKESNIDIVELVDYKYPTITNYGILQGKKIKLISKDNKQIFYSIDEGKTWEKYEKEFFITKDTILMAREDLLPNTIVKVEKRKIIIEYPVDALPANCYDGDISTGTTIIGKNGGWGIWNTYKIAVDESMYGKNILVTAGFSAFPIWADCWQKIDFHNKVTDTDINYVTITNSITYNKEKITIPENTDFIKFTSTGVNDGRFYMVLYEIGIES